MQQSALGFELLRQVGRALFAPINAVLGFIEPVMLVAPLPAGRFSLDWSVGLLLYETVTVWIMRSAAFTQPWQEYFFWAGLPLLFIPLAARAVWPGVAPGERLFHLVVLAESTFVIKLLYWPANFAQFDEYLHWVTASDILTAHKLFLPNPLLPVSPLLPGLELVTTALTNLSGTSLFIAAGLVTAVIRAMFIGALYAFYSRISGQPSLAAIGSLAYMGAAGYVMFDSQFAYETLALGFMAVILAAHAELAAHEVNSLRTLMVMGLLMAAVTLTHHITALVTLSLLGGVAVLQCLGRHARWKLDLLTAAFGAGLLALWLHLIGNPLSSYIGPIVDQGIEQFLALVKGSLGGHGGNHSAAAREPFVAEDGSRTPIWLQVPMIAALPVTALLLANGFLTALAHGRGTVSPGRRANWRALAELLRLRWQRSWMLLIALLALTWPLSILLRLTTFGWQIGNRLSVMSFFGVGVVIGSGTLRRWHSPRQWVGGMVRVLAMALIFTGGVVSGWGRPATHIGYKVEADALSLEPMGIDAAVWMRQWLGMGNRVATDLFNGVLLASYGRQDTITSLYHPQDPAKLFLGPEVTPWDLQIIREDRIDYLVTDLRLSTKRSSMGSYFGEDSSSPRYGELLDPMNLMKWGNEAGVSRIFDDGWINIYDVTGVRH